MKLGRSGAVASWAFLVGLSSSFAGDGATKANQMVLGFSKARLERASEVLDRLVTDGKMMGGVLLVLRDGKVAYEHAFGYRDKEAASPMRPDSIFRIASQTKAVVSAGILMLLEEGKFLLSTPVSRYLPSFAHQKVISPEGKLTDAKRDITLFDLLTHTSGLSYGEEPQVEKLFQEKSLAFTSLKAKGKLGFDFNDETVCAAMERLGTLPLISQPGEAWVYGFNTDVLGCVIEKVSGVPLDQFIRERITIPLKMKDTTFFADLGKLDRLVSIYYYGEDGKLSKPDYLQDVWVRGPRKFLSGGAGMVSTASDYARFLEMIRRGGELDGVRILAPGTVALMTTNQIGNLYEVEVRGRGWGLGFETIGHMGAKGMMSPGSFGWAGGWGTVYWVDPRERLTVVWMNNLVPTEKGREIRAMANYQVYQALLETSH